MNNLEVNKFLEKYYFPTLNQEERENMKKKSFISKEMETVIKKHPNNKCPEPGGFIEKFYHLENT